MKEPAAIFTFLFMSLLSSGQSCEPCDVNQKVFASNENRKFTYTEITELFCTIRENCSSIVEFTEMANEKLFQVLESDPTLFTKALDACDEEKKKLILLYLENPVNDKIDLEKVFRKISGQSEYIELVNREIEAITKAARKIGIDLKE